MQKAAGQGWGTCCVELVLGFGVGPTKLCLNKKKKYVLSSVQKAERQPRRFSPSLLLCFHYVSL